MERVAAEPPSPAPTDTRSERLARQLALAHLIERLIETGVVRSYGEVGRALGLSQPRISQVMRLLWLPPRDQEEILLGESPTGIRQAMRLAQEPQWPEVQSCHSSGH